MSGQADDKVKLDVKADKNSLKLFISVDLVGSTSLKNQSSENEKPQYWIEPLNIFYKTIINDYIKNSDEIFEKKKSKHLYKSPEVWKLLGDEIIFCIDINYYEVFFIYIEALKKTFTSFRNVINQKKWQIDVKATMWIAGFPVINSIVDFSLNENKKITDYIGPSMDIGFRLTKFATPRKIIISIELLYLLCHNNDTPGDIHLFTSSKEKLKGVLNNKTYPIFWIDAYGNNELEKLEDKIYSNQSQEIEDLKKYTTLFIESNNDNLFYPFIEAESKSNKIFKQNKRKLEKKKEKLKQILPSLFPERTQSNRKLESENKKVEEKIKIQKWTTNTTKT